MSVDTYLKRKNLAPYQAVEQGDVKVLVSPNLLKWAKEVHVGAKQFLIWRSFHVDAEHQHLPTCAH